ncbi:MAG: hypothetical protein CMK09_09160 [Ponticaulis sp.]|nr:hypothetical protein [Ponticaulis sp.]
MKKLTAGCISATLGTFAMTNAEANICDEIEWWVIEGKADAPFVSLDPDFETSDSGNYRSGAALETYSNEPCGLYRRQETYPEGTGRWTSLSCQLPVNGAERGSMSAAKAAYQSLKDQLNACSALRGWRISEDDIPPEYEAKWYYPVDDGLTLELASNKRAASNSNDLTLTLERFEVLTETQPATTEPPLPTLTARPRNQIRWATQVAEAYPEIARRLGWEGTVGLTVIVGTSGRVEDCRITRTSGWSILDHTACESMKSYARFYAAEDDQGTRVDSKFSTRIAYQFQ